VKKRPGLRSPPESGIKAQMEITLPLEKMTIAEKLRVMETLWSDLSRDQEQFESPEWHGEVLRERVARVKQGKESFVAWETAKSQLRNRLK
jgi:putative addiction module component (TIGR02574 family)